jgi:Cu/Ag efflux pump CusA
MPWIIAWSLKFRMAVVVAAVAISAIGIAQLRSAPVDVLPEFTPPYVEIQTEANGLSADEVEQLITVPLEADLLNGVQGVEVIRSRSLPGLSSVVLVFEPGTDVYRGRQLVQERLTQLGGAAWPMISKPSVVLPPLSSSSRVLMIGLSSSELTPIEQSVIARWTVRPRLMGVPGVANVAIWGMRDQQLQVQVDPEQLRRSHVTLSQVVETAGNAQVFSPLSYLEASTPGTGGFIETGQQRLQVRNVLETIADPNSLGQVPVEDTGGRLELADVATVTVDHQPLIGDAVVNDGDGLLLVVEKYPGADTAAVTSGVEQALEKLRPGLTGLQTDTAVFKPSDFLEDALNNLTLTLIVAALLMLLALAALFFHWRTVFIVAATIPVALIAAAWVLDRMGESFNVISFAGLAMALPVVIDEGIVAADAVAQRLRRRMDTSTEDAVLDASRSVRSPLVYATLIALLPVVPVAVMNGRPGEFFGPLVVAYVAAVAVAMLVAVTLAPALSLLLFEWRSPARGEPPVARHLLPRYGRLLGRIIGRPRPLMIAAAAAVVLAVAALPLFDMSAVPSIKDRHVLVHLDAQPGTSQPQMTELTRTVSGQLRALKGVEGVAAHVGRAVTGDQLVDVNSSEVWVAIESDADYGATLDDIRTVVGGVDAVRSDVVTYTDQRIRDIGALREGENNAAGGLDVLTGVDRPLTVRVYGQDQAVLNDEAEKVRGIVSQVDGVVDPTIVRAPLQPSLEINVDLAKARQYAIKPGDVRRSETTLLQGILVGSVFQKQKVFDVVVQGTPSVRRDADAVRNLLIDRPGGGYVRLGQVADVRIAETPSVISRDAVSRHVDVVASVSGRDLGAVASDIRDRLASASFPLEYHAQVLERTTADEIGERRVLGAVIAALIGMFLLVQAGFQSWRLAALLFVSLPFALVGGVAAAMIDGAQLSLGAWMGLLAVFALAVRGGMLLFRHFQDLEAGGQEPIGVPLVERGARDRLMPTLTTAVALAAVALPTIALGGRPGLEIVAPMAAVVLGGMVTTVLLITTLLPALYLRFAVPSPGIAEAVEHERWDQLKPRASVTLPAPAAEAAGGADGSGSKAADKDESDADTPLV